MPGYYIGLYASGTSLPCAAQAVLICKLTLNTQRVQLPGLQVFAHYDLLQMSLADTYATPPSGFSPDDIMAMFDNQVQLYTDPMWLDTNSTLDYEGISSSLSKYSTD